MQSCIWAKRRTTPDLVVEPVPPPKPGPRLHLDNTGSGGRAHPSQRLDAKETLSEVFCSFRSKCVGNQTIETLPMKERAYVDFVKFSHDQDSQFFRC